MQLCNISCVLKHVALRIMKLCTEKYGACVFLQMIIFVMTFLSQCKWLQIQNLLYDEVNFLVKITKNLIFCDAVQQLKQHAKKKYSQPQKTSQFARNLNAFDETLGQKYGRSIFTEWHPLSHLAHISNFRVVQSFSIHIILSSLFSSDIQVYFNGY